MSQENQPLTRKCPFCTEEILVDTVKCKYCGGWLNKPQDSNAQAPWRLVILSILTLNIYQIYWFYLNWKYLKKHKGLNISPGWRTVGLFVPIYGIILIYRQFRDIRDFAVEVGCKTYSSPGWLTFGFIILCSFGLPISLLAVWPLVEVHRTLNTYWEKEQPELTMRTKFSTGEIVSLVIGGLFWSYWLFFCFLSLIADILSE